ncbi:MFS transporter [Noviherbaspirillum sp.]|uniref:MFS transporter n=1 Tax=Noviherbaspirillum sp. TaxID=1926288 RepID=UPI002FE09291
MKHALYTLPVRRLFIFALLVLLVSQSAISLFAWSVIEKKVAPELDRKATTVGKLVVDKITRALDHGIPFNRLEGVDDFFNDILKENEDIGFLAITAPDGTVLVASGVSQQFAESALPKITAATVAKTRHIVTQEARQGTESKEKSYVDTPAFIRHQGKMVGVLHVGVDQSFIASKISEVRYDIGIILLTSMLIAFEILLFVISRNFSGPMRQIAELMTRMASGDFSHRAVVTVRERIGSLAEQLNRISAQINQAFAQSARTVSDAATASSDAKEFCKAILGRMTSRYVFVEGDTPRELLQKKVVAVRILTFLFMFAEMLSRPFLPLYAGTLPNHGIGLPPDFLSSLPITAYLLGVALSMPFAGRWSDLVGRRRSYMTGAMIVTAGLLLTGLVPDFFVLVGARAMTGVGYAVMFMACQGYIIDNTENSNRGQGIAMFVGAIMVAEICAPAVGGILADRVGYRLVFMFGALIAVLAAVLATGILDNRRRRPPAASRQQAQKPFRKLAGNYRFGALAVLSGIPAKLIYSGFLIYLVPVLLTELGSSKSEIGRYAMIYGVVALALAPVFARIADRYNAYVGMVSLGGLLTGGGLLPILLGANPNSVMLGIAALGLGQSMSISAQLVLVARVTKREAEAAGTTAILGVFRLVERLGAAAGPAITGAIVASFGTVSAMAALGIFGVISSVLFSLIFFFVDNQADEEDEVNAVPGRVAA